MSFNQAVKQAVYFDILVSDVIITVPGDYPTIQAALDTLAKTFIPPDVTLTIKLGAGVSTFTAPTKINHANGDRIVIEGTAPVVAGNISSFGGATVSGADVIFSYTLATTSHGLAVGDIVSVNATGGTGHWHGLILAGAVNTVSGAVVTVKTKFGGTVANLSGASLTGGQMKKYPTVLKYNGSRGIVIDPGVSLAALRNVAIVGNGVKDPIDTGGNFTFGILANQRSEITELNSVVVTGFFSDGVLAWGTGAYIWMKNTYLCGNGQNGARSGCGGFMYSVDTIAHGNGYSGLAYLTGSNGCGCENTNAVGNKIHGVHVDGCSVTGKGVIAAHNTKNGFCIDRFGEIALDGSNSKAFSNGGNFDVVVNYVGYVAAAGMTGHNGVTPRYWPAANVNSVYGYIEA